MNEYKAGFCTLCGSYSLELTPVDDDAVICDECLMNGDFIRCSGCGKYYSWNAIRFFHLRDDRTLCENCFASGNTDEDDIQSIEDHTSYADFDYVNLTDGRKG